MPILVVTEVAHLVGRRFGTRTELLFLENLAERELAVVPVEDEDWLRIAELVARYRDLPLGTVDASIVAAAERLGITTIATLDRRHFAAVKPAHIEAFALLP